MTIGKVCPSCGVMDGCICHTIAEPPLIDMEQRSAPYTQQMYVSLTEKYAKLQSKADKQREEIRRLSREVRTLRDDLADIKAQRDQLCQTPAARALLAADRLASACEDVFDDIDAVGTSEFYQALDAYRQMRQ